MCEMPTAAAADAADAAAAAGCWLLLLLFRVCAALSLFCCHSERFAQLERALLTQRSNALYISHAAFDDDSRGQAYAAGDVDLGVSARAAGVPAAYAGGGGAAQAPLDDDRKSSKKALARP